MLAHLEHLDLTPLLVDLNWLHIRLGYGLDSHLLTGGLMSCQLHCTELALAQRLRTLVVVVDIVFSNYFLDLCKPFLLVIHLRKVQDAGLVWRQDNLHRVQSLAVVRVCLNRALTDESASEAVHHAIIRIALFAEAH